MSDNDTGSATAGNGTTSTFTERELQMLGWAMQSLKTGPPEVSTSFLALCCHHLTHPQIDYNKLANFAGMSNPRSAGNAWAKIKAKLILPTGDGATPAPTPKKAAGRKKANAAPAEDDEDGEAPQTPKKTPRKRAAKKSEVDGEEASPKKRGRPAKKQSEWMKHVIVFAANTQIAPKAESAETQEPKSADAPVKTENAAEDLGDDNIEDEV
jgi:hypothetical protein